MRKYLLAFALFVFAFVLPQTVRADSPQPVQYAMVQCSGGLGIDNLVAGEQQFDTQYGFDHQLTTPAMWQASYIARVNEFAHALGCPQMLQDDGTPAGALSFAAKIYAPTYQRILSHNLPR